MYSVIDLNWLSISMQYFSHAPHTEHILCVLNLHDHCRLEEVGYGVGRRVIELISCRERITKRETRLVNFLQVLVRQLFTYSIYNEITNELVIWHENYLAFLMDFYLLM